MEKTIDKTYLETLHEAIQQERVVDLQAELANLYIADIAQILKNLDKEDAQYLFHLLDFSIAGEVLVELGEEQREDLLAGINPQTILTDYIHKMNSDDAADFINELPGDTRESIVDLIAKSAEPSDRELLTLLAYKPDTAGGLMATELIRVNMNWKVSECQEEIRKQAEQIESIYKVFVEDNRRRLKGYVSLTDLILTNPTTQVKEVYKENIVSVEGETPAEDVANIMRKYDYVALPVVNKAGILLGRITIDDVLDFVKEEAEEDYQLMSGISEDVQYSDRVWVLSRARLPWLLLGLLGGMASAKVISLNEGAVDIYPQIAFFIPLIAAMGGNAGIQASAIVVQGLASKRMATGSLLSKLLKELSVALLNGILCGVVLLGLTLIFYEGVQLGITVSLALLAVIVIASILGVSIPLVLNKMNIDPALATGPFITTTNDLVGLGIYFLIARFIFSLSF